MPIFATLLLLATGLLYGEGAQSCAPALPEAAPGVLMSASLPVREVIQSPTEGPSAPGPFLTSLGESDIDESDPEEISSAKSDAPYILPWKSVRADFPLHLCREGFRPIPSYAIESVRRC